MGDRPALDACLCASSGLASGGSLSSFTLSQAAERTGHTLGANLILSLTAMPSRITSASWRWRCWLSEMDFFATYASTQLPAPSVTMLTLPPAAAMTGLVPALLYLSEPFSVSVSVLPDVQARWASRTESTVPAP